MKVSLSSKDMSFLSKVHVKVLFLSEENAKSFLNHKEKEDSFVFSELKRLKQFDGKDNEYVTLYGVLKTETYVLMGLGTEKKFSLNKLKDASANLARISVKLKAIDIAIEKPDIKGFSEEDIISSITEGLLLGEYEFSLKGNDKSFKIREAFICNSDLSLKELILKEEKICSSVNFARNLINGNADLITSEALLKEAKDIIKKYKLKGHFVTGKELLKKGLNLLYAVGKGAFAQPSLITVEYLKGGKKTIILLVGKGVTFDSGGLNLKPTGYIETMKRDMAGAAAVLGAIRAIASLNLKVNVVGVLGCAENTIGPLSYKPGDVFKAYNGKTVEVTNTDAEGRLVLADSISYSEKKYNPEYIIDIATLTGAVSIALGNHYAGLLTEDSFLREKINEAAKETGEKVWELPLTECFYGDMKSDIADLRNTAKDKNAGTIYGAVFLREFVEKAKWAHLDIAGVAYSAEHNGVLSKFGNGFGVRLLTSIVSKI